MTTAPHPHPIQAIAIGTSAGGVEALNHLFRLLPEDFGIPMLVVLHLPSNSRFIPKAFSPPAGVRLKEADEKEAIQPRHIYFAPSDYHLLVESDRTLSLSTEAPVHFARPSIDVLFESAAEAYGPFLAGVILTGANDDGAAGLKAIKTQGGLTLVQNLEEAQIDTMPCAAIKSCGPHQVLGIAEIATFLTGLDHPEPIVKLPDVRST